MLASRFSNAFVQNAGAGLTKGYLVGSVDHIDNPPVRHFIRKLNMLKTNFPFKYAKATSAFIDELQDKYARLKIDQRLNKVDLYDAEHGGGFDALGQAEAEQEELEINLGATESCLRDEGETPKEGLPELICTPQELKKLQRYYKLCSLRFP